MKLPFTANTLPALPVFLALTFASAAFAGDKFSADDDPENFHLEVTGSAWLLDVAGTIHSDAASIDLRSDLGFEQQIPTFSGKLVVKPGRKHRIFIEGTPLTANGVNSVSHSITYHGRTFNVSDTLKSSLNLNLVIGGYQYDVISNRYGHLGFSVSGVYLNGTGTLTSVTTSVTATASETIGLVIAGAEFRIFPIPRHKWFDIDGGLRGMGFGSYGHYVEGNLNGGLWLANHFSLAAGYRRIDVQLQNANNPLTGSGINTNLKGPIFSAGVRW
jgi:hypothetical protein